MSSLIKNLLIALIIAVLLAGGYYYFIGGTSEEEAAMPNLNSEAVLKTEKILADTQKINNYRLDTSIFEDVRFRSLEDFRVDIQDINTGRENPFAPVQ